MVGAGVQHFIFSSTAATFGNPVETPITEGHPQRPINAYGETKLAVERALPHFERAYGITLGRRCAISTPRAPIPTDCSARTTIPKSTSSRARSTRRSAAARFAIYGADYDTPDGTCLRDYVHVTDLASAHVLALDALRARRRVDGIQSRQRPADVGPRGDRRRRAGHRPHGPGRRGPRRPGDPAILFASSEQIRDELGWTPAATRTST